MDQPEGYGAYYDLRSDPWQVNNTARLLTEETRRVLRARLQKLRACKGQAGCA